MMPDRLRLQASGLVAIIGLVLTASPVIGQDADHPFVVPEPPLDGERALVVDVIDGDTIVVERDDGSNERVRYIGIDAPEIATDDRAAEPGGPEAAAANRRLVGGEEVLLGSDVSDRDQFDRLLRYVWLETPDGWLLVNDELVALGLAEVRAYEPDTRYHAWMLRTEEGSTSDAPRRTGDEVRGPTRSLAFVDAYNDRDVDALRRLLSPHVVYRRPGAPMAEGVDAVLDALASEWSAGAMLRVRSAFGDVRSVAIEMTFDVDGGALEAVGVQHWVGDQLAEYRIYVDPAGVEG